MATQHHQELTPEQSGSHEMEQEVNVVTGGQQPAKRKQVRNACVNCQKACKKCADQRPCPRCVRLNITDTCIDSVRKPRKSGFKRGPYKKSKETEDGDNEITPAASGTATPVHASAFASTSTSTSTSSKAKASSSAAKKPSPKSKQTKSTTRPSSSATSILPPHQPSSIYAATSPSASSPTSSLPQITTATATNPNVDPTMSLSYFTDPFTVLPSGAPVPTTANGQPIYYQMLPIQMPFATGPDTSRQSMPSFFPPPVFGSSVEGHPHLQSHPQHLYQPHPHQPQHTIPPPPPISVTTTDTPPVTASTSADPSPSRTKRRRGGISASTSPSPTSPTKSDSTSPRPRRSNRTRAAQLSGGLSVLSDLCTQVLNGEESKELQPEQEAEPQQSPHNEQFGMPLTIPVPVPVPMSMTIPMEHAKGQNGEEGSVNVNVPPFPYLPFPVSFAIPGEGESRGEKATNPEEDVNGEKSSSTETSPSLLQPPGPKKRKLSEIYSPTDFSTYLNFPDASKSIVLPRVFCKPDGTTETTPIPTEGQQVPPLPPLPQQMEYSHIFQQPDFWNQYWASCFSQMQSWSHQGENKGGNEESGNEGSETGQNSEEVIVTSGMTTASVPSPAMNAISAMMRNPFANHMVSSTGESESVTSKPEVDEE